MFAILPQQRYIMALVQVLFLATMAPKAKAKAKARAKNLARRARSKQFEQAYRARLKACAAFMNAKYNVEDLCKEFPSRVAALAIRKGGRLAK